jgi:DNA-binding response OmpR family regulator
VTTRILIVEDNALLAASLVMGFSEDGLLAEAVASGALALARLASSSIDLAIVDLGLPDIDGMQVVVRTRAAGIGCPILVLTARDGVAARVAALDAGADDYVLKPVAFDELLARVRALSRRAQAPRWPPLAHGKIVVGDDLSITAGDQRAVLSPKQHALLAYLVRREGEVARRAEILLEVFGYRFDPGTNVLDVHVSHLRRRLAGFPLVITTVRGLGFRLEVT